MKTKTNTPAHHDAQINLLCLQLQMHLWRARNKVTLATIIESEREKRFAAQIERGQPNRPRLQETGKSPRNPYQVADRYDIARTRHMRSRFRRNFR